MMQASSKQMDPTAEGQKQGPHRWVKGQSGNPAGRAKHVLPDGRTVREHARAATPAALEFLRYVMMDETAPLKVRVSAAIAIVRTGHADATAETVAADETPRVILVDRLIPVAPTPGVIASPIQGHVATAAPSVIEVTGAVCDPPASMLTGDLPAEY